MNDRLLLVGVIGFALGVCAGTLTGIVWPAAGLAFLLSILFGGTWAYAHQRAYLIAAVFFLAATLGMARVVLVPHTLPDTFVPLMGTTVQMEGVIVADPDIRERTQRLTVEVEREGKTTRFLVVTSRFPEFSYGERVSVKGTPEYPEPFDTDGGRVFRYDQFLLKDGIFALIPFARVEHVGERKDLWIKTRGALSDMKFAGIGALAHALPEPHASLAAGLILGGKQGLGESLLDEFIRTGLIHIVVLSGYNVMIIADFIMRLFGAFSRRWSAGLGALAIALFVLAAGAGPASIRAGIMALIALYGRATGRTYDAFRALLAAGVLMILWNPLTLVYDPGFQLSFVATLGLIFGAPIVERWLAWAHPTVLREIGAATIAAQIAVLPLLLYQNGLFSVVALPANLLVLAVVPLAMLASFVALLAGWLMPVSAPLIGLPAYVLLSYIIGVVEIASRLPFAAFILPQFPFVLVLTVYAVLAYLVRFR